MLVDDSGVTRALMTRWLVDAGIDVVATARDGQEALETVAKAAPDVLLLDVEMPRLGGIEVLPALLAAAPDMRVIMASSLTTRSAEVTIEAFRLGASDAIAKPMSGWASHGAPEFRGELVRKVRALGESQAARPQLQVRAKGPVHRDPATEDSPPLSLVLPEGPPPDLIVIGASTGGPNALFGLLARLPADSRAPIVITQHMPPTFTKIFAEHLGRVSGRPAQEAEHGAPLAPGSIYVAPGGRHLEVMRGGPHGTARLSDAKPENFCRPSVNPLFRSAAAWGEQALALVLTGMGTDGLEGVQVLKQAGGRVAVQDAASSIVWGMPGCVARAGLADAVLGLEPLRAVLRTELTR
jgi:two-component system chemotaxis response regulator CheB